MRIVAFITEPQVIDRILDHFRRTAAARHRSRAPRARARMVRAAAGSASRMLLYRQPRIVGSGYSRCPGVPMTDRQDGKQPSSGTNRPVPGMRATGDCPGTLIPLAGHLQDQGRYLG